MSQRKLFHREAPASRPAKLHGEDLLKSAIPIAAAIAALAAGCTVDDVRDPPVLWSATYPVEFDALTDCLVRGMSREYDVGPQIDARERRGIVTVSTRTIGTSDFVGASTLS